MGKESSYAENLANVTRVLERLRAAGHEAWLNGGCVRDHLLGREPADFDVATSATPDMVEEIFPRSIAVGKAFGVIRVLSHGDWFEVATFRRDGRYLDGRRPDSVTFSSAEEDAARRDFTINGMFWDPATGEIRDFVGGREDLARRIVRAIGDPDARLSEDALRILRAVRFAAKEGFVLDPATRDAVVRHREKLSTVAAERVREELAKISSGSSESRARALILLSECRLLEVLLPEAKDLDVKEAAEVARRCPTASLPLFLAALLSRAQRADARPPAWVACGRSAARRLRLSNEETDALIDVLACRIRVRGAVRAPLTRRRILATMIRYPLVRELLQAEGGAEDSILVLDAERASLDGKLPGPLLDGHRLLAIGVPPRKAIGAWLKRIHVMTLAGRLRTADEAEAFVRRRLSALA